jgi:hypothetical protein
MNVIETQWRSSITSNRRKCKDTSIYFITLLNKGRSTLSFDWRSDTASEKTDQTTD